MNAAEIFCRCADLLPVSWAEKIKITANVLLHDWQMEPPTFANDPQLCNVTEDEVRKRFAGLDELSITHTLRYLQTQRMFAVPPGELRNFFYNWQGLLTRDERQLRDRMRAKLIRASVINRLFPDAGAASLLLHHGLFWFPSGALKLLKNGVLIDAGACTGDSTAILLQNYPLVRSLAFEPIPDNVSVFRENMKRLGIAESRYEILQLALGDQEGELTFTSQAAASCAIQPEYGSGITVKQTTLDACLKERPELQVRFIKADLEGMGAAMLRGAKETIRKNRPLLSLSIYHTREELFEIYRILTAWQLNYRFAVRMTAFPFQLAELSLLGYPAEAADDAAPWRSWLDVIRLIRKNPAGSF